MAYVIAAPAAVKTYPRLAATISAMILGLGLAGLGVATEAQAQPGPFPQAWCPGDFWDPSWGENWDWNNCHASPPPPPPPPSWNYWDHVWF
jgi:hypothetical protein